jgi:hypothetical protein
MSPTIGGVKQLATIGGGRRIADIEEVLGTEPVLGPPSLPRPSRRGADPRGS